MPGGTITSCIAGKLESESGFYGKIAKSQVKGRQGTGGEGDRKKSSHLQIPVCVYIVESSLILDTDTAAAIRKLFLWLAETREPRAVLVTPVTNNSRNQ